MKKTVLITCMAAFLAAPAMAQVDLTRYVALGDSLTAGIASASYMDYYQQRAYPQRLATQAGAGLLEGPFVAPPGFTPILVLNSLSPLSIGPTDFPPPEDLLNDYLYNLQNQVPYENLGISGANTGDIFTKTGNALNLVGGNFENAPYDITLRIPQQPHPDTGELVDFTAMIAAIAQEPTFLTVWAGNNDVLRAVTAATPIDGITMTEVEQFTADYATLIGGLATSLPDTDIVVLNVFGDARWIPFTTTTPTTLDITGVGTVPVMGENGPLEPGDYVTLPGGSMLAQGMGLPIEGSPPLPEDLNLQTGAPGVILRAAEIEIINERMAVYNTIIAATAAQFSNVHLLDINPTLEALNTGTYQTFGGITLTEDFLLGGVFSYDGFHPQQVGQAVIAVELIDYINAEFNASIPQIDMYSVLTEGGWQAAEPFAAFCGGCDAKSAVLTREGFMQLYRMMMPEMAARWSRHLLQSQQISSVD